MRGFLKSESQEKYSLATFKNKGEVTCRSKASRHGQGSTLTTGVAEASARHWGKYRPLAFQSAKSRGRLKPGCVTGGSTARLEFQSTSGRDARRGVPSAPGESKRLGIPRVRRSGGLVQALGRLHVVPLGKGVAELHSATRRAATPSQKNDKRVHLGHSVYT